MRLVDSDISWAETDDGIVILNLRTSRYLTVNVTGRMLWNLLRNGATHQQLEEALIDAFGLSADRAREDTTAFLDTLREQGFVDDEVGS